MRFKPELNTKGIPDLMMRAGRIAPYGWWKLRLDTFTSEQSANPLLTDYFDQEFQLERTYGKLHDYHKITGRYPDLDTQYYELISFLASLVLVHERLSEPAQKRLQMGVKDGLQDAKGLAPLATELRTAVHLMLMGYDVEFSDLEGKARFDLLAVSKDLEIEIDCKAPSGDVGRKIHGGRFRALAGQVMPALRKIIEHGRNYLVTVTIPENLHGDRPYEQQLTGLIDGAVAGMRLGKVNATIAEIAIEEFQITDSPFGPNKDISAVELANFLKEKFALENVNAAFRWSRRGAFIFVIKSERADRVVDGIYRQLKGSAGAQFSGNRPAMLCVQLRDFTAPQLRDIAGESPNGLQMIATRLFSGDHRRHLAGISYVANEGALTSRQFAFGDLVRTSYQDVGTAYVFANPKHPAGSAVGATFRQPGLRP